MPAFRMQRKLLFGLALFGALWVAAWLPFSVSGQEKDPLDDPLVLGAWLYQGKCTSCHGSYEKSRLGDGYDEEELYDFIDGGSGGCQVSWGRQSGGPFGKREINAIILYFLTWEELGGEPDLPTLPPQPTPTVEPTPVSKGAAGPTETPTPTEVVIAPEVERAIQGNPLAQGAWLYTQNCYRCHLSYEYGRQGTGLDKDRIKRTIENGKSGTSMMGFSRQQGGTLKMSEINAIVTYIMAFEQLDGPPALPDVLFVPPTPDPASLQPIPLPAIPWVEGDAGSGAGLFVIHCQECHGQDGAGELGPRLAKYWPSARPDLTIQATIRDGVPGTLMRAWAQAKGGPLSDQQIADLTTTILSWADWTLSDRQAYQVGQGQAVQTTGPGMWWWVLPGIWGILLIIGRYYKQKT